LPWIYGRRPDGPREIILRGAKTHALNDQKHVNGPH
jgi:hypothetical protein